MDSGGLLIETGVRILSLVALVLNKREKKSRSTGDSSLPSHHFE